MERTVVIGAGPAGLAAAHELSVLGRAATVFEKDEQVGGIARTVVYRGYRFDIGGHRFFTRAPSIQRLWEEAMGDDFLVRPRLSRIHYNDRFFHYPLKPVEALLGLGPVEALRILVSYLRARAFPIEDERSFEDWVVNRFGRRLFEIFFQTYTEKVWGRPCSEIGAEWAAQRIKNLDLVTAVRNAILGGRGDGELVTTLIDRFHYPRLGPGMMWERWTERLAGRGIEVRLGAEVTRLEHDGRRVVAAETRTADGVTGRVNGDHFISTMPIRELVHAMDPPPPPEVVAAADTLKYRDFLTVVLIVDVEELFPDNWIYIHSPDVRVGRIQNFKNWSPEMVPDASTTSLGLEYFVHEGDDLWSMPDAELIALGARETARLGLVEEARVRDGAVVRVRKAYPVYDGEYREALDTIRGWTSTLDNLQLAGRNGQHRYNNQDHSMLTGNPGRQKRCRCAPRHLVGERRGGVPRGDADRRAADAGRDTRADARGGARRGLRPLRPASAGGRDRAGHGRRALPRDRDRHAPGTGRRGPGALPDRAVPRGLRGELGGRRRRAPGRRDRRLRVRVAARARDQRADRLGGAPAPPPDRGPHRRSAGGDAAVTGEAMQEALPR